MQIVPDPDWRDAAATLNDALQDDLINLQPNRLTVFVVGPPHGGVEWILRQWAEQRQRRILPGLFEQFRRGEMHDQTSASRKRFWISCYNFKIWLQSCFIRNVHVATDLAWQTLSIGRLLGWKRY
ncbi:MAG: hypothetical protein KDJ31_05850 [Candidatus Competibacteraceae bacterium]|nr:hypothetical protein [Candidatus Competibacteraceae bacterium]